MTNARKIIGLLAFAVVMQTGCSSSYDAGEAHAEFEKNRVALEKEKREEHLDSVPDWFLEPDQFDANGFYAVGMQTSKDMNIALTGAKMRAQADLAGNVSKLISAQEKLFNKGSTVGVSTVIENTINSFINEQDVAGTVYDRKEVKILGDEFVAYVRAYLPVKALQKAQQEAQFAKDLALSSRDAQDELMLRVAQAKAKAEKEKAAETARLQAEADARAARIVERAQVQ